MPFRLRSKGPRVASSTSSLPRLTTPEALCSDTAVYKENRRLACCRSLSALPYPGPGLRLLTVPHPHASAHSVCLSWELFQDVFP